MDQVQAGGVMRRPMIFQSNPSKFNSLGIFVFILSLFCKQHFSASYSLPLTVLLEQHNYKQNFKINPLALTLSISISSSSSLSMTQDTFCSLSVEQASYKINTILLGAKEFLKIQDN